MMANGLANDQYNQYVEVEHRMAQFIIATL